MPRPDRPPGRSSTRFVTLAHRPLEIVARLLFDFHVRGREHLPEPPYILAANHLSFIDPVFVTIAAGRNIRYLAVADLFDQSGMLEPVISYFGAIPTPRDRIPIAAIRTSIAELEAGHPIGLFPEGRRTYHWREQRPYNGAAWLSLRCDVPVVPVALVGTEGTLGLIQTAFRRTAIGVWIEPAIRPADFRDRSDPVTAMSAAWHDVMSERLDPWWPEHERPTLA